MAGLSVELVGLQCSTHCPEIKWGSTGVNFLGAGERKREGVKVTPMCECIQHERYKEHDIRSNPRKDLVEEKWKVRIDITFPTKDFTIKLREYLDEKVYSTVSEAHTAGFEYGRRIIEDMIREQSSLPSSK